MSEVEKLRQVLKEIHALIMSGEVNLNEILELVKDALTGNYK